MATAPNPKHRINVDVFQKKFGMFRYKVAMFCVYDTCRPCVHRYGEHVFGQIHAHAIRNIATPLVSVDMFLAKCMATLSET